MPEYYDMEKVIQFVKQSRLFGQAACVMGDFVLRCTGNCPPELYLAMVLTVQCSADKHICLKLPEYANKTLISATDPADRLLLPELSQWLTALRCAESHGITAFSSTGTAEQIASALLVIDNSAGCYLQRQWSFEQSILQNLLMRAEKFRTVPVLPENYLHNLISFFPTALSHPAVDYQQLAVMAALRRNLLILSGGPGTGKTTVAAAILASMLEQQPDLQIKLAAPTAKAAVRLLQSLKGNAGKLSSPAPVKDKLSELESSTVHSLLGTRYGSHEFFYNSSNPLSCDILLIDECSMVSHDLMARTLEALPPHCMLILLGDRHQLASVEAGAVMADICDSAEPNCLDAETEKIFFRQTSWHVPTFDDNALQKAPLHGALVELKENHRFADNAVLLGEAAALIRNLIHPQDAASVAQIIAGKSGDEFEFKNLKAEELKSFLENKFKVKRLSSGETFADLPRLASSGSNDDRRKAFELMDKLKILCPAYDGVRGIDNINQLAMQILHLENIYTPGAILLIKRNDYRIDLVNGDTGLVGKDSQGNIKVFFADKPHAYNIGDLPEHEAVFAMTVHKSQGSGFGEVVFIMPEKSIELMTRELVYTAMTRAENKLCCIGTVEVFTEALSKETMRMSNLSEKLKNRSV